MYFRFGHPVSRSAALVALTIVFFLIFHSNQPVDSQWTEFCGTWIEENGEPGNYIRFWQTRLDLPGSPLEAYEGWVELHKLLGEEKTRVRWNYAYQEPLTLNVIVPGKCKITSVRMLNADHMLIRFSDDASQPGSDVFAGPDVKLLKRVRGAEKGK